MGECDHLGRVLLPAAVTLLPALLAVSRGQRLLALVLTPWGPLLVFMLPYLLLIVIFMGGLLGMMDRDSAIGVGRMLPLVPWTIAVTYAVLGGVLVLALRKHS